MRQHDVSTLHPSLCTFILSASGESGWTVSWTQSKGPVTPGFSVPFLKRDGWYSLPECVSVCPQDRQLLPTFDLAQGDWAGTT